jgi:mono/diheme cytochrome c family protein
VTPRLRNAAFAMAGLVLAAGWAWDEGLFRFLRAPPKLVGTPAVLALGQSVLERRCLPCHSMIPLEPRVRGWTALRAYEAIGNLPKLRPAMPPFGGTDEERRALAVYLEALGAEHVRSP